MKFITFNTDYVLKPDNGKALVMAALVGRNSQERIKDSFTNIVHPIYAMILSFIDGREKNVCIEDASNALGVPKELIENFIDEVTDNADMVYMKSKDGFSAFPPNTVVVCDEARDNHRYEPEIFDYDKVNLTMDRHLTPSSITMMFNNICVTNCIYCYQDKSRKVGCSIPLDRIMELIHEAYRLHVTTIDVIGGEFFLYKYWREVLRELRKYGYNPFLSTKMPITEDDVKFLAEINTHDIQVSVDTLIEEHLISSLKVKKGYVESLKKSISLLNKYGIPVIIHTVLTQYNDSIEDMLSVYEAIKDMECLVDWHVVKGDPTLYPRTDYSNIEISRSKINALADLFEKLNEEGKVKIHYPKKSVPVMSLQKNSQKKSFESFMNRSMCSGLYSSLYILPDGKVTICEQLYWNKRFIVGNVLHQSIEEIWNSKESNSLFYIDQASFPEDSLCHSCKSFKECRSIRQVCYRDIIRQHGKDKWYYPDTNCPLQMA